MRRKSDLIIKVLSLGVGMAIAIILIAKVCFELSYDSSIRMLTESIRSAPEPLCKVRTRISVRSAEP